LRLYLLTAYSTSCLISGHKYHIPITIIWGYYLYYSVACCIYTATPDTLLLSKCSNQVLVNISSQVKVKSIISTGKGIPYPVTSSLTVCSTCSLALTSINHGLFSWSTRNSTVPAFYNMFIADVEQQTCSEKEDKSKNSTHYTVDCRALDRGQQ